jgi:hypothetical protein
LRRIRSIRIGELTQPAVLDLLDQVFGRAGNLAHHAAQQAAAFTVVVVGHIAGSG